MRFLSLMVLGIASTAGAGESAEALRKDAARALSRGDLAAALTLADKAVARDGQDPKAYLLRAAIQDACEAYEAAVSDYSRALALEPRAAEVYNYRGSTYFKLGQFAKSVADFDRFLELKPSEKPGHWRRGISLYYAGRYEEGQKQFEGCATLDSNDVENAVWHYLCVAHRLGPEKARAAPLKIGKDTRVPMQEIYDLFAGRSQPATVLAAAQAGKPSAARRTEQLFYAQLYLGLYYDVLGEPRQASEHLTQAVNHRIGHTMWDVARVHRHLLAKKAGRGER